MKKALFITSLAVLVTLSIGTSSVMAEGQEDTNVSVTVSDVTQLDVRPSELSYSNLDPGDFENISENDFYAIEVANIGSENISQISAESTMPESNPFGTGESTDYDSGNFIKLATETANNGDYDDISIPGGSNMDFHFLNRLEFEEDPVPTYIQTHDDVTEIDGEYSGYDVGRFRMGSEEYFYVIYHADDGAATCTGSTDSEAEIWIGTDAHTPTTLGTYDFTYDTGANDANDASVEVHTLSEAGGTDNFGLTDSSVDLGDESYNVYTYCDSGSSDGHTIRTRFNMEVESPVSSVADPTTDEETSQAQTFILDSTTSPLQPGASFPLDVGVQVPLGVAEGEVEEGTLTVLASN